MAAGLIARPRDGPALVQDLTVTKQTTRQNIQQTRGPSWLSGWWGLWAGSFPLSLPPPPLPLPLPLQHAWGTPDEVSPHICFTRSQSVGRGTALHDNSSPQTHYPGPALKLVLLIGVRCHVGLRFKEP